MDRTLHLLMLILSCQELAQEESRSIDCWRPQQLDSSILNEVYSLTSSANSLREVLPVQIVETSFMYIKNNTGPKTEPCGTPLKTSATLEKEFSKTTH